MSANFLLNLLNLLGKRVKMRGLPSILSLFRNEFTKFNNTGALMRPSQGGGGVTVPLYPEINWLVPLFPKNRKFVFLCSLFPNIVFVPLFPSKFDLCSPKINTLFPLFPQTPGRASLMLDSIHHMALKLLETHFLR